MARDPLTVHTEADLVAGLQRVSADGRLSDVPELQYELLHLGLLRRDAEDPRVVYVTPEGRRLLTRCG